jgi:hypothetical protein
VIDQKHSLRVYYHNKFVGWLRNTDGRQVRSARLYLTAESLEGDDAGNVLEFEVTLRHSNYDAWDASNKNIVIPDYATKDPVTRAYSWFDALIRDHDDYELLFDQPYFEPHDDGPDDESAASTIKFAAGTTVLSPKSTVNVVVNVPGDEEQQSVNASKIAKMIDDMLQKAPKRPNPLQLHKGKYGYTSQQKIPMSEDDKSKVKGYEVPEPKEDRYEIFRRYHTGGIVGHTSPLVKLKGGV